MRVDVKPELLRWARERAGFDLAALATRFPHLADWERGDARPTLKQLEQFAKATHAPVGFLFLPEPPVEEVPIPDFRTVANRHIKRPSPDLLDTVYLWGICALITAVAVAGKLLGSALAARLVGIAWPDSLRIGVLMNTRGLMGIVVLNIGYDLGILSPAVFTMMVVMALATTCMTGPGLNLLARWPAACVAAKASVSK